MPQSNSFKSGMERFRRVEQQLQPKPKVKPVAPVAVPAPRPTQGYVPPTQEQQVDRVLSYMPDFLRATQYYMQTGKLNRSDVLYLDKALDGLQATAHMDRGAAGRLLYMATKELQYPGIITSGEPSMVPLTTPLDQALEELSRSLDFAYKAPPPGMTDRVMSFLGQSYAGSPLKWTADKLMADPWVRDFSKAMAAAATPALASAGGFLPILASMGTSEIAGLGELEAGVLFTPTMMPKTLGRGLLEQATKLLAKGEALTPAMQERLLAEAGLAVTTADIGRPVVVAGRNGVLSGFEQNVARVTLPVEEVFPSTGAPKLRGLAIFHPDRGLVDAEALAAGARAGEGAFFHGLRGGGHDVLFESRAILRGDLSVYYDLPRIAHDPVSKTFSVRLDVDGALRAAGSLSQEEYRTLLNGATSALRQRFPQVGVRIPETGEFFPGRAVSTSLAKVTFPEGRTITVAGNSLLKAPSAGWGTDLAIEAAGLRAHTLVDSSHPLQVTPGGLLGEPASQTVWHGTSSNVEQPIMSGGFRPTVPQGPGQFRAVYTSSEPKTAALYSSITSELTGGKPVVLGAEAPSTPKLITYDDAYALHRELGLPSTGKGWDRLSTVLRRRGYDGVDLAGSGAHMAGDIAWLQPNAVSPKVGTPSSWEDFMEVARGVMTGDANVFVLNPISGGATGSYSPALEALTKFITNNSYDKEQFMLSASRAARTVEMPEGTVGKMWNATKRIFNPSVGRYTRESFIASYAHREIEQTAFAARMLWLQKAVQETLGVRNPAQLSGTPFMSLFKGTMPESASARAVVGSFEDMMTFIEDYNVPERWKAMSSLWKAGLDNDFKLMQDMGYPGSLIDSFYVPHAREQVAPSFLDNFFRERAGTRGAGRLAFTRERKYATIREWADFLAEHGETPELDPMKLYARRLLGTANMRTNQVYIQGILRAYGKPIPKGKTPLPGWTEILPGATPPLGSVIPEVRIGRWAVPDNIAAEARHFLSVEGVSGPTRAAEEVIDVFRGTLLSIDLSPITIQGYSLAMADPVRFLSQAAQKGIASMTEEGFILELINNLDAYNKAMRAGVTMYISAADVVKGFGTKTLIDRTPGIKWINQIGYGRWLPMMKKTQWESMTQMLMSLQQEKGMLQWFIKGLPKPARVALQKLAGVEGKTPEQLAEAAADVVNNIGGGINWAKTMSNPSVAAKFIILTEGWVRANVGRIITTAKFGDPRGVLARRWLFQNLAMTTSIAEVLSMKLSGRHVELDPRQTDFLDIQIPGGTVPILPGKTYIRTIIRAIAGKPWDQSAEGRVQEILRFGEGRYGQFVRIGMDIKSGKDFFGRPIDQPLLYMMRSLLPLAGQAAVDMFFDPLKPGPISVAAQFGGLNFIPTNSMEARDTFIKSLGWSDELSGDPVVNYFDLSEAQRKALDERWPEYTQAVRDWQRITVRPIDALNKERASTISRVEALGKAFLGQPLTMDEQGLLGPAGANLDQIRDNPNLYASMLSAIQGAYYAATPYLVEEGDKEDQSTTNQVVQGYYRQVVEPAIVGGVIDSDIFYDREARYRAAVQDAYGDEGIAVLDRELILHATDDPVAAGYHVDARDWAAYYRTRRDYWSPTNAEQFGIDRTVAAQYESFDSYRDAATIATTQELTDKPLDQSIGQYRSRAGQDTIYTRFGIKPGQPLTEQQANEVAEELVRLNTQKYQDALTYNVESWLIEHPKTMCNLAYWGRLEPTERVRPYLALCERR